MLPSTSSIKLLELQQRMRPVVQVPASALLKIIIPFLIPILKQSRQSNRIQEIHCVFKEWYADQSKSGADDLAAYPSDIFPDSCYSCGFSSLNANGSLFSHCSHCRCVSENELDLYFLLQMIFREYNIHRIQLEAAISWYLYERALKNIS